MKKLAGLLMALAFLLPTRAMAADRAEIMLLPTRIVMEKSDRYVTIIIKNVGNATGNLSIEVIDMEMPENGGIVQMEEGKKDPYSAIPYLRLSPRSITIKPGETQNVRLMLRKPADLATGEYRSHVKVKIEDDNVEQSTAAQASTDKKEAVITVKAKLALTIPVIVRTGDLNVSVKISNPKVIRDAQGTPVLDMTLLHEGNRSVMGDFSINYSAAGEQPHLIKSLPGIPVYRSTDRRHVSIPLDGLPAGVDLSKGKLSVTYTAQEKEGGMKLDSADVNLAAR